MSKNGVEKLGIRTILSLAKCGRGLHVKIPPKIERAYDLESGDTILLQLIEVRHATIREGEGGE